MIEEMKNTLSRREVFSAVSYGFDVADILEHTGDVNDAQYRNHQIDTITNRIMEASQVEPEKPERPTCATCPFYFKGKPFDKSIFDGGCRFNPPLSGGGFPPTLGKDWCGRHPGVVAYLKAFNDLP